MRLIKMLGLSIVAACAVMALIGVGTASAGIHESMGFCKANQSLLCAAGNLLAAGTLKAHSAKVELKNNAFFSTAENCELDLSFTVSAVMKNPIKITIPTGSIVYVNCSGPCTTIKPTNLPWEGELSMGTVGGATYQLTTKKLGVSLSGCTFGTECEYGAPAAGVSLTGENSAEGGTLRAVNVGLEYKSGSGSFVCGSTLTWNTTYTGSPTKSWYFTLLGTTNTES